MDVCWVTGPENSGVTEQSRVIAPELDATLVVAKELDIPSGHAYVRADDDAVYPTGDLADAVLALDPDVVVFHTANQTVRRAVRDIQPHAITVCRVGVNIQEQMLAGPKFVRQVSDLLEMFNTVDHLVASSHRARSSLQAQGIDDSRITKIPTAIKVEDVQKPTLSHTENIGLIGRVDPIKNQYTAIEGISGLRRYDMAPHIHLAGNNNGAVLESMQDIVMQMSPNFDLTYYGFVEEPLDEFYPMLDVHCHPSWTENCPQTLLEAALAGVPSIVSDLSWSHAYGDADFVRANPDDPMDWAAAIHQLLSDPDHRRDVAEKQQYKLLDNYRVDDIIPMYRGLFSRLRDRHDSFKVTAEVRA